MKKNDLAFQTKFDEYVALCNIAGVGGEPGRLSAGSRGIEKSDRFEDKKRVTLNKLETSEKDITGFVTVQETKNGVYQSEIHHEAGLMKDLPFDQLVKAAARIVEDFYSGLADKKTKMVIHAGVDPKLAEAIRMYTAVKEYRPPISHAASVEKSFFSKVGNSFDEDRELKKFGKVLFEKRTDIFPYSPQLGINKFCDVQADLNEVRKQTRTPTK